MSAAIAGDLVEAAVPEVMSLLLPVALAMPLATALLLWAAARTFAARRALALAGSLGALAAATGVFRQVGAGNIATWRLAAPAGTPLGLSLRADGFGATFALVAAFVWAAATLYAWSYMQNEHEQNRFFIFLAIAEAGTLGVAYAGDFITLLPFFELMSLMSYVLVAHKEDPASLSAGNTYLYMSACGGILLLAGIASLYHFVGTTAIGPLGGALSALPGTARWITVGLLVTGFAVKAGVAPLHVWLPKAHPVAPSPASALLSGVMIKTGAYGIIRTVVMGLSAGPAAAPGTGWETARGPGILLIWAGVLTMLVGVGLGLLQHNAKRMLAYSSVSQMGYILVGAGAAAYLGSEGGIALGAAVMHIVNHALFKACLFLAVGAVLLKTGQDDFAHLGGLWRSMPFTAFACLVATCAIAGLPGLNGYISKTLLHDALKLAAEASQGGLLLAERLFLVTGAGTAALVFTLFARTFLGPARPEPRGGPSLREDWPLKAGMGVLAAAIMAIGAWPGSAIQQLLARAVADFGYGAAGLEHIAAVPLFAAGNISAALLTVAAGGLVSYAGVRSGLFGLKGPAWLSVEHVAVGLATLVGGAWTRLVDRWANAVASSTRWTVARLKHLAGRVPAIDYLPAPATQQRRFSLLNLDFAFFVFLATVAVALILVVAW